MNTRIKPSTLKFMPSEWVLCSKTDTLVARDKTKPIWTGPYRVVKPAQQSTCLITDLLGTDSIVHASRLWPYAPPQFTPSEQLVKLFKADKADLDAEKLLEVQFEQRRWCILVKRFGFEESDNSWEPMRNLAEDIQEAVEDFLLDTNTNISRRSLKKFNVMWRDKHGANANVMTTNGKTNYQNFGSDSWLWKLERYDGGERFTGKEQVAVNHSGTEDYVSTINDLLERYKFGYR
eukprot:augustus_masked-scaffold_10-processed-gene-5.54-mRNA-1 protein AED:1.00 eAED:1.00 QI:0/0/0/0/1/1/2/0/233